MLSVQVVAELDAKRAWFHLGMSVEQLALHVGISPSQYYKRLKAAKIMDYYPDYLKAFSEGEIQISHIAMIGNRITPANSNVILDGIRNKSKREVEEVLARVTSCGRLRDQESIVEKTLRMTESQAAVFDRVLEVMASKGKVPTAVEGLVRISESYLNISDPMRIAERAAERAAMRESRCKKGGEVDGLVKGLEWGGGEVFENSRNEVEKVISEVAQFNDGIDAESISVDVQIANEPGEHYSPDELNELTPLERIKNLYKNKRRPIRAAVRNRIWLRDGGRCTFVHANGERCKERKMLEVDHLMMVCRGGTNDEENLALKCRFHNQFIAERQLGNVFMADKRQSPKHTAKINVSEQQ